MGQYLDTSEGGYYARTDELTDEEKRNFENATKGTRIRRLAISIDYIDYEEFFFNSFFTGAVIFVAGLSITLVISLFSEAIATAFIIGTGCLALFVFLGVPILLFFAKVSSEISQEHWIRPRSYWRKHLEASPNVLKLDGEGVRPAVAALGASD